MQKKKFILIPATATQTYLYFFKIQVIEESYLSLQDRSLRRALNTQTSVKVQFFLPLEGGDVKKQEASALLSKKLGERGRGA